MMEPRIQYAKTADGLSIAFYAIGQGPPQVYMVPHGVNHLELEWQIPQLRQAYERAARHNLYVRYDPRGFGLSDRDIADFSVEALVRDLEAVADHLGLDRFQLVATFNSRPWLLPTLRATRSGSRTWSSSAASRGIPM